jgi:hypothetical protein
MEIKACCRGEARKRFFFEKKEPKNLFHLVCTTADRLGSKGESFLVLFFKKEPLPCLY